jgi:hypothetical protein
MSEVPLYSTLTSSLARWFACFGWRTVFANSVSAGPNTSDSIYFGRHCILSDIRLWVGDTSTFSCLV